MIILVCLKNYAIIFQIPHVKAATCASEFEHTLTLVIRYHPSLDELDDRGIKSTNGGILTLNANRPISRTHEGSVTSRFLK